MIDFIQIFVFYKIIKFFGEFFNKKNKIVGFFIFKKIIVFKNVLVQKQHIFTIYMKRIRFYIISDE